MADESELQQQFVFMSATRTERSLLAPEVLAGIEKVVPGGAERIIAVFERQNSQRNERERFQDNQSAKQVDAQVRLVDARIFDDRLKLALNAVFIVSVIGVAALLAWKDHPAYAVALIGGGGGIAGVASGARWLMSREPKSSRKDSDE